MLYVGDDNQNDYVNKKVHIVTVKEANKNIIASTNTFIMLINILVESCFQLLDSSYLNPHVLIDSKNVFTMATKTIACFYILETI